MNILIGFASYLAISLVASVVIGTMLKAGSLGRNANGTSSVRGARAVSGAVEAA